MNDVFIKKMIRAKLMEYSAIKAVLPKPAQAFVEESEKVTLEFVKSVGMEVYKWHQEECLDKEKAENNTEVKGSQKIKVDFD